MEGIFNYLRNLWMEQGFTVGLSIPIEQTGYTNMRNIITLIDAICDAYDNKDFSPTSDGTTFCNIAVSAVCSVMGYTGFMGLTADQIVDNIPTNPDWSPVPMEKAQDLANQGSLLIAGLDGKAMGQAHGHVVVIRPGKPCYSGKWGQTPRCLNIGSENFLARAKRGPLVGMAAGLNEAFIEMPKIYVWRQSL